MIAVETETHSTSTVIRAQLPMVEQAEAPPSPHALTNTSAGTSGMGLPEEAASSVRVGGTSEHGSSVPTVDSTIAAGDSPPPPLPPPPSLPSPPSPLLPFNVTNCRSVLSPLLRRVVCLSTAPYSLKPTEKCC